MKHPSLHIFTKYGSQSASTRHRFFQFDHYFEKQHSEIKYYHLLDNDYFNKKIIQNKLPIINLLKNIFGRIINILTISPGSIVIIHTELIPYFPPVLEFILKCKKCHIILDIDDALFHQYDNHSSKIIRVFFGEKIKKIMILSYAVFSGSPYIKNYAEKVKPSNVFYIPTVIDIDRYAYSMYKKNDIFTVVWIGSPTTSVHLNIIQQAMKILSASIEIKLRLVGASKKISFGGVLTESLDWNESTEIRLISESNVGIMPLNDDFWERGKCGFKIIQYMGCALPVIATPVGVNKNIINHGRDGFLASTTEDWVKYILYLYENNLKASCMGRNGRLKVEKKYSSQVVGPKIKMILSDIK